MKKKQELPVLKPITYYQWETKKVSILWHGITQPYSRFYTALEALTEVKKIVSCFGNIEAYKLNCDGEILNCKDYI